MAILAGGRETRRRVFGTVGRVVIGRMTTKTGVRGIVVIPVVAGGALVRNQGMRTIQRIIVVVNRERSRRPARSRGMAHRTIRRDI